MKRVSHIIVMLVLVLGAALWSRGRLPQEPALMEVHQGGRVYNVVPEAELPLERRPFTLRLIVRGYTPGEHYAVQLAGDTSVPPPDPDCFKPAHSLAIEPGGYSSFYLSWRAGHYLFYEPGHPENCSLTLLEELDSGEFLTSWEVKGFQKWTLDGLTPTDWEQVPDLQLLCHHPEEGRFPFSIRWTTPAR